MNFNSKFGIPCSIIIILATVYFLYKYLFTRKKFLKKAVLKEVLINKEAKDFKRKRSSLFEKKLSKKLLEKEEFKQEIERNKQIIFEEFLKNLKFKSQEIICSSFENYSTEIIFNKLAEVIKIDEKQFLSRIIGKDGRNINAFKQITRTDLIIKEGAEKNKFSTVQISSFNSLRRAVALETFKLSLEEKKFSPERINKNFLLAKERIKKQSFEKAKEVIKELKLNNFNPELIKILGNLNHRTSYGQNVLEHSFEVAKISGKIAAEIDLVPKIAKRAGLLHDIGKSIEDDELSHVTNGIKIAEKFGEDEIIINSIASHHKDVMPNNLYSLIVIVADKISAARPGARTRQLESYLERMNNLEKIANKYPGIKKSYAFQSGREIWIIADSEKLSDRETWEISKKIKEEIINELVIPGDITLNIVREKKFVYKLNTRGKQKSNENSD